MIGRIISDFGVFPGIRASHCEPFGGLGTECRVRLATSPNITQIPAAVSATRLKRALAPQGGTVAHGDHDGRARGAAGGPVLTGARDAAERARAFRRARRHSLLVKVLRVALPMARCRRCRLLRPDAGRELAAGTGASQGRRGAGHGRRPDDEEPDVLRADKGRRPLRGARQEGGRRVQPGGADQADRHRRRPRCRPTTSPPSSRPSTACSTMPRASSSSTTASRSMPPTA